MSESSSPNLLHFLQGLDGKLIIADDTADRLEGRVACRERIGGTLKFYYREAA